MKTYDETIDAIFAKGDAILEQKKKRSAVIKQTSYAVSGVCAAAIVGVGIWRITDHGKMPESGISNIETAEEATTGVTVSSSATVTVSYTQTTNKTSTVKTTQTSSTKTSGENKVTTNTEKTVLIYEMHYIRHTMENVYINLKSVEDEQFVNEIEEECKQILEEIQKFL